MLSEVAEDVWIHFANRPIDVDFNARRRWWLPGANESQQK
jgi:hypothetical protein